MSADDAEDSQMLSSPESTASSASAASPPTTTASTSTAAAAAASRTPASPTATTSRAHLSSAALSPPSSQHGDANSNGKRPIQTISNGGGEDREGELHIISEDMKGMADGRDTELAAMNSGKARVGGIGGVDLPPTRTHEASGYAWRLDDDAPGFAGLSKKAVDDAKFVSEAVVHGQYGVKRE